METEKRHFDALSLVACTVSFATSAPLNKLAMQAGLHPVWLNVFRLGFAVLLLLPFYLKNPASRGAFAKLPRRDKGLTILSGLMLAVHFASWATALRYADSLVAVTIWSTFSLMTVIGSALFLREKTPWPALLGIMVATIGVGICAVGAGESQGIGVAAAVLAALSQAVYTLCGRAVRKNMEMLPYTMVIYSLACAALLVTALALRLPTDGMNARGIGASLLLALICTLGGHSMQNYALKFYKAPTVSAVSITEVFTGPLLVYFIFGEMPATTAFIGGAVIMLGVFWYMIYERRAELWRFMKRWRAGAA